MAFVCSRCADQKVTSKILCNQVLQEDVFNLINSFNRCEWCDDIVNTRLFKESYNSTTWFILHHARTLQSIKTEINDKNINKYINKHAMGYLRYVGHCLSFGHKPLDRYKNETEQQILKMIQKRKNRKYGDDDIDLKRLSYYFFSNMFLKKFDNEKAQFMIKILFKILYF